MITGSNFRIRTILQEDLDQLLLLQNDHTKYGDFLPVEITTQAAMREDFIKTGFWTDHFRRLVMVDDEGEIIGTLWIFRSVPYFDAYELGYKLFYREHWSKGIITEAMTLIVDYVFSAFTVRRVEIRCDVANEASAKIARKLGFVHEGISRKATFARGEHRDMHLFALLREEWASSPDRGRIYQRPDG